MTHLSPEAARMARARRDFVEAMARGCSIPDLRKARAGCSRRVEVAAPVPIVPAIHELPAVEEQSPYWWLRD
jgi:hypothetical protein